MSYQAFKSHYFLEAESIKTNLIIFDGLSFDHVT